MFEWDVSPHAGSYHFFVLATFSLRFLMCFFTFSFLLADFSSRNAFFLSFLLLGDSSRGLLPSAMLFFPSSSTSTPDSAEKNTYHTADKLWIWAWYRNPTWAVIGAVTLTVVLVGYLLFFCRFPVIFAILDDFGDASDSLVRMRLLPGFGFGSFDLWPWNLMAKK